MAIVLGIDTSAYTTSAALVDAAGIRAETRELLTVPPGKRGLRPEDAFFAHVRRLPDLLRRMRAAVAPREWAAIAVSARPRPREDSYLPPFEAGRRVAEALAIALDCPLILTTHQEGHIQAGLVSAGGPSADRFWAIHVSGGTTELLAVERTAPGRYAIRICGGSQDLYGGQLIDRVGVALGLGFPAGPALEELAGDVPSRPFSIGRPMAHRDGVFVSFSGPEAEAMRRIGRGEPPTEVAAATLETVAEGLIRLAQSVPPGDLLVVGGVAANRRVRARMRARLGPEAGWRLYFAEPELSRDNAVGVAFIGLERGKESDKGCR